MCIRFNAQWRVMTVSSFSEESVDDFAETTLLFHSPWIGLVCLQNEHLNGLSGFRNHACVHKVLLSAMNRLGQS